MMKTMKWAKDVRAQVYTQMEEEAHEGNETARSKVGQFVAHPDVNGLQLPPDQFGQCSKMMGTAAQQDLEVPHPCAKQSAFPSNASMCFSG